MTSRAHGIRRTLAFCGVLSISLLLVVLAGTARAGPPAGGGERADSSASCPPISNAYLTTSAYPDGAFIIGTTGGDPSTPADDNKRLLYDYGGPWSSFTTVRHVTGTQINDFNLKSVSPEQAPAIVDGQIAATWLIQGVEVQQGLSLYHNPYTGREDTVRIEYTLTNRDSVSHDVGVRVMLDVMIGDNDGAPYLIPGQGNQTGEVEYLDEDVPTFWEAFESPVFDPWSLKGMGILRGGGATPPDRFVIARWPSIYNTNRPWDYVVTQGQSVTVDSATALYWNPTTLAPGDSRTVVTYYGLSGQGGGDAWFVAPSALTCDDLSFDAVLRVSNDSIATFTGGSATIALPQGLALGAGESATRSLEDIPPGETASVSWHIVADETATGVLSYSAEVTFTGGSEPLAAEADIEVPDCTPTVTPTPTATVTPTATSTPPPTATPTRTPTPPPIPVERRYCSAPGDLVYRIDASSFRGYASDSASRSPLIHITSPPAPVGWNEPGFVLDDSWRPGASVWWDVWEYWGPLIPECSIIGLLDRYGEPKGLDGTTYLYRRIFTLSPPEPGMAVTRAVLRMWSDNKTAWWWEGELIADDRERNVGEIDLFPARVDRQGGTYLLAIQNSNDYMQQRNPQGTAFRLSVTWGWSEAYDHHIDLPLLFRGYGEE